MTSVSAMDPQPRNLAQLATALQSSWLNIPVNTKNLIGSLPARLAAACSAKGGYSPLFQAEVINMTGLLYTADKRIQNYGLVACSH